MATKVSDLPDLPSPSGTSIVFALDSVTNTNTSYQLKLSTLKTFIVSSAYNTANTANNTANGAVVLANSAFTKANSSYLFANSAFTQANNAYSFANSVNILANSAFTKANDSYTLANSAFTKANDSYTLANSAFTKANDSYTLANSAFTKANSVFDLSTEVFDYANSVYLFASSSFDQANSANALANSAFSVANIAYEFSTTTSNVIFGISNTALEFANSAFTQSNTILESIISLSAFVTDSNTYTETVEQLALSKITAPESVLANTIAYFSSIDPKVLSNCSILIVDNNSLNNIKTLGFSTEYDNGDSDTSKTIYLSNGQRQKVLLTANADLTVNTYNALESTYTLRIIQNSSGNNNVTWVGLSTSRWIGSSTPHEINLTANGESLMSMYFDGSNIIQNIQKVGLE